MKQFVFAVVILLAGAVLLVACRQYLPTNRFLQLRGGTNARQSTADARGKFDHDRHAPTLDAANVACLDCHRFDALIDTRDAARAGELSAQAMHSGSAPCHHCHSAAGARAAAAPTACLTCHDNILPLRPADHDLGWLKVHANMARVDSAPCESCHRQSQCINCHERRDSIQTVVHERNFRFFHGIQARANPMQCSSCHREDYCIRCHESGGAGLDQ